MSYKGDYDYGCEARVQLIAHLSALVEGDEEMTVAMGDLLIGLNWATGEFERARMTDETFACVTTLNHRDGKSAVRHMVHESTQIEVFSGDLFVGPMRSGGFPITYSTHQLKRFCMERKAAREEAARATNPDWAGW